MNDSNQDAFDLFYQHIQEGEVEGRAVRDVTFYRDQNGVYAQVDFLPLEDKPDAPTSKSYKFDVDVNVGPK